MSGHSHFKSIKYQKAVTDAKRSQSFSRLAREITIAARQGGDQEFNAKLRIVIEKAKSINMPTENIERAIKRGTGELEGKKLEEVLFEGYGPGGVVIMVEGITDNKKRALSEVRRVLSENGGKLVGEGAVKWMFERKGCITVNVKCQMSLSRKQEFSGNLNVKTKEDLELLAIEAGAEDIYWHNDLLDVYTKPEELDRVKKILEEKGIKLDLVSLDWVAKEMVEVGEKEKDACQRIFEALDEVDDVQEIYSNLNP